MNLRIALLAGVLVACCAATSHARLILTIDDLGVAGGPEIIVIDNVDGMVGDGTPKGLATTADGTPTGSVVSFSGTVGAFFVQMTVGYSAKPGPGNYGQLHLHNLSISGSAGSLEIMLTDTDFDATVADASFLAAIGGVITAGGSVTYEATLDTDNVEFGAGLTIIGSTFGAGAFSEEKTAGPIDLAGTYSMTQTVRITHSGAGTTSLDLDTSVVPEPVSLAVWSSLAGIGLAVGGVRRWSRQRRQPRAAKEVVV